MVMETDLIKEHAHVVNTVNRHTRHADITWHARVITVIAPVRGEIEGNGKTLLSCGEIAAVKGIGVFSRRKACILPNSPRALHIHGRVGAANVRREAGMRIEIIEARYVRRIIGGFDVDAFG
jgi:hypothetical protein